MKAACFSVAAMDYYPQLDTTYPGGNSLNQSIRFRQMGHASAFVGAIGNDKNGDRIMALLQERDVDATHLFRLEGDTASNQLVVDEAGERTGLEGAWHGGVYEEYKLTEQQWQYIADFDVWATHANGCNYQEALKRKHPRQFMAVDFLHLTDYDLLKQSLTTIDVAYFGGTPDMAEPLAQIAKSHPGVIVLTLGAGGSIAFHGNNTYTQPALPIEKVVDTTGCGDAFQAGFTCSYYENKDIPAALLAGAELGRIAASQYGGTHWG
jgi:fructoselysine 6-kinase